MKKIANLDEIHLNEILRQEEQKMGAISYEDYPDTFKEAYPKKGEDVIKKYYRDQAPRNVQIYDRRIASFYTQFGIQKIDAWFSWTIQNLDKTTFIVEQLERLIRRNPHLHNVIKTNLINNLHSRNNKT